MFKSGDKELCPVIAWSKVIKKVRRIKGATDNSEVSSFLDSKDQVILLRADYARSRLQAIVQLIGEEKLGFGKNDISLHSICSGGAMAMFLSGISVIIIQRVGRWSSKAFLEYIREQVESFTLGVSSKMLQFKEFMNLNNDLSDNILPPELLEDPKVNEDGPDSIPFKVSFNSIALSSLSLE